MTEMSNFSPLYQFHQLMELVYPIPENVKLNYWYALSSDSIIILLHAMWHTSLISFAKSFKVSKPSEIISRPWSCTDGIESNKAYLVPLELYDRRAFMCIYIHLCKFSEMIRNLTCLFHFPHFIFLPKLSGFFGLLEESTTKVTIWWFVPNNQIMHILNISI